MIEPTKESILELAKEWKFCERCHVISPTVQFRYGTTWLICDQCFNIIADQARRINMFSLATLEEARVPMV